VLSKTIKVQNTGPSSVSYDVKFRDRTTIPGAVYTVSPSSVMLAAGASANVKLTLTITPGSLTKTIDPTVDRLQGGLPREYQADASGFVQLSSHTAPTLRVPAYAAPRPASKMTQPSVISLSKGAVQTGLLPLTGLQVNQGSGAEAVQSTVAGFELQAKSGLLPSCTATITSGCVGFPDERAADLKYVGATSDAPQLASIGQNIFTSSNGLAYFAINTQGPWRTAASSQEFDIYIDSTGDGVPDSVLFNTRLTGSDTMVTELFDLNSGAVVDLEGINDRLGDTDTALFNSDTLVMPVAVAALPGISAATSRISYAVLSFSPYHRAPVDQVGDIDATGHLVNALSFDVAHPGIAVFGSYDGSASALLFRDSPGSVLEIRRDTAAYKADHGLGALIVHFQNKRGYKAQVISVKTQ
jgi:hypothetical protein